MSICEHCGKALRAEVWEPEGDSWQLRWVHDDSAESAPTYDHEAWPAPQLPLGHQEGTQSDAP